MVQDLIWRLVLIASLAGLVITIPAALTALADAMRDDTPAHLPTPQRAPEPPVRVPVARLTRREYRRILRDTEVYKRAARAMRSPR